MPSTKFKFIKSSNINSHRTHVNRFIKFGFWVLIVVTLIVYRNSELLKNLFDEDDSQFDNSIDILNVSIEAPVNKYKEYFVNTSHCRMPQMDPFSAEIKKIYKPQKFKNCTNDKPLVTVLYDMNKKKYLLHIETETFLSQNWNASNSVAENELSCCYRQIVRSGSGENADDSFNLLPCVNFKQNFVVPEHIEFIIVECSKNSITIQKDAFSFIQYKNKTSRKSSSNEKKPNVFLIGIDSLSRMNIRRTMPQTHKYLEENNWFELQGYNKVGDNTFPNLLALLNGNNETVAWRDCKPTTVGGFDKCYLIWQDYRNFGYRTAYAEDVVSLSTFNYLKKGFTLPPTDYYMRPMGLAIEKNLKVRKMANLPYCLGRKHYGTYIYDYALQLANYYKDEPIFGLFWTNSFSHERFYTTATMDVKMLDYFRTFKSNNILENTIVIFFSDHGRRFGTLVKLTGGFLEERLPMFYISLPKWFKNQYPDFVRALQINRNRLTTPYDIHMTLKHILELGEPGLSLPTAKGCEKCQSIFYEIPENRSCIDASIPEHWCTCTAYENQSVKNKIVQFVTKQIIDQMNDYIKTKNLSNVCSELKLKEIKTALLKLEEDDGLLHNPIYRIEFVVKPKYANYVATAIYNNLNKKVQVNVEDISCLSEYEEVARCVNDNEAKKYCICKWTNWFNPFV